REELRLCQGREVPALIELVVMDEFGISPLGPTSRGGIDFVREDAHGNRDGDIFDIKKGQVVFPIETSGRNRGARQPIESDVVEDVVSREAFSLPVEDVGNEFVTTYVVVEYPRREADG